MLRTIDINNVTLQVVEDDILGLDVEAITCYSSRSLTLHSLLAQRLVERGGSSIRAESSKHAPAAIGDALVLPGGKLALRYIIVAVVNELRLTPTIESIAAAIGSVLQHAAHLRLTSLAIPLLRAGRQLLGAEILRATLAPLIDHCYGATTLQRIYLVADGEPGPHQGVPPPRIVAEQLDELCQLGALRARAAAIRQAEQYLQLADQASAQLIGVVLSEGLALQEQLEELLRRSMEQRRADRGAARLELQQCLQEQVRLSTRLGELEGQERYVGEGLD